MDRDQAKEIKKHLTGLSRGLERALEALVKLDKPDQALFKDALLDMHTLLIFKLKPTLYREYPDLEPPDPPQITSTLRWQDVSLPHPISEAYLDALIFAELKPRFLKMARIVGNVCVRCEEQMNPVDAEIIAARVIALAEAGRIEGAGDLRMWRHSEVRLRP